MTNTQWKLKGPISAVIALLFAQVLLVTHASVKEDIPRPKGSQVLSKDYVKVQGIKSAPSGKLSSALGLKHLSRGSQQRKSSLFQSKNHQLPSVSDQRTDFQKGNTFYSSRVRRKKAVSSVTTEIDNKELQGRPFYIPPEWRQEGNYSALRKLVREYSRRQMIAHDAQIAFLCSAFLLCFLSFGVWYSGMCHFKRVQYKSWSFQDSHMLTSIGDILKRRLKYLPEESFYEQVLVRDRGTDP